MKAVYVCALFALIFGLAAIAIGNAAQYDPSYQVISVDKSEFQKCAIVYGYHVETWASPDYCGAVGFAVLSFTEQGIYGFSFVDRVTGKQLASGVVEH